jgi:hypothetical protein
MGVSDTGANDRESLATHPSRAQRRAAHHEEKEDQKADREPVTVRTPRPKRGLGPSGLDGRGHGGTERHRISALRTVHRSNRPRPRRSGSGGCLALTATAQRPVAGARRRRPRCRRSSSMPRQRPLPMNGRRLRRRADPDRRAGRATGFGDGVGRRGHSVVRDRRRRLRSGRRRGCGHGLVGGWRCGGSSRCDRRGGRGLRFRCGRRLGRARRVGSATRRKQLERVDVRLGVAHPDAEVHVRHDVFRVPGRAGLSEDVPFRDNVAATDVQFAEMRQCRLVLARRDRDRQAVRRDRPGEGHRAGYGRPEHGSAAQRDVDASMLPGRIRVAAHREPAQHWPFCGPGPRPRGRAHSERADECAA